MLQAKSLVASGWTAYPSFSGFPDTTSQFSVDPICFQNESKANRAIKIRNGENPSTADISRTEEGALFSQFLKWQRAQGR
jgi:hypothetical protein